MLTEVCCVVIAALCEKIESCWTASIAYSSNLKNRVDEVIEKAIVDHSDRMIRLAVKTSKQQCIASAALGINQQCVFRYAISGQFGYCKILSE